jgi:hypothetical protein
MNGILPFIKAKYEEKRRHIILNTVANFLSKRFKISKKRNIVAKIDV